jgi:hypothetical protein
LSQPPPRTEGSAVAPRLIDGFNAAIDQTIAGAVLMILGKMTLAVAVLPTEPCLRLRRQAFPNAPSTVCTLESLVPSHGNGVGFDRSVDRRRVTAGSHIPGTGRY